MMALVILIVVLLCSTIPSPLLVLQLLLERVQ